MAIYKKLKEIEELEKSFNINQYTIQYDTKSKRFFNAFAPKALGGGAVSVAAFAGLGVVSLLTGGLGLGIGAIAGLSVAAGAGASAVYGAVQHRDYHSKTRFNDMGIDATIEYIKKIEDDAAKYAKELINKPNTKKFLYEGKEVSRSSLKKIVKENSSIAYSGLKYILNQGLIVSDNMNELLDKQLRHGLSEDGEEALKEYGQVMDNIAKCTQYMARQRTEYNPYKGLIIDNMQEGCLLGVTSVQNEQIRLLAKSKDKKAKEKLAVKLYSNMYEIAILNEESDNQRKIYKNQQRIDIEHRTYNEILDGLIARGKITQEMMRANGKAVQEVESKVITVALIALAEDLLNKLPRILEFKQVKEDLNNARQALMQANFKYNDAKANNKEVSLGEMERLQIALDTLVEQAQTQYEKYMYAKGHVEGAQEVQQVFDDYKVVAEVRRKKILNRANTIIGMRRGQVDTLTQQLAGTTAQLDELQNEFEAAATGYYEESQKLKREREEKARLKKQVNSHSEYIIKQKDIISAQDKEHNHTVELLGKLFDAYNAKLGELDIAYKDLEAFSKKMSEEVHESLTNRASAKKAQEQVEELKVKLSKALEDVEVIKRENRSLTYQQLLTKGELKTVKDDLSAKITEIDALLAQVGKLSQENTEWMRATTSMGFDLRDASEQIEQLTADNTRLTSKHKKATAHVETAVFKNQELQQQVVQLTDENKEWMRATTSMGFDLRDASEQIEQLTADNTRLTSKHKKATAHVETAVFENQELQKQVATQDASINALRDKIGDLDAKLGRALAGRETAENEAKKARGEVVDVRTRLNKAQAENAQKSSKINNLEESLRTSREQTAIARKEQRLSNNKARKLASRNEELTVESDNLKQTIQDQDRLIASMGDENKKLTSIVADKEYDVHRVTAERDDAIKSQRRLEKAMEELVGTISTLQEELEDERYETSRYIAQKESISYKRSKDKDLSLDEKEKQEAIERLQKNIKLVKTFADYVDKECPNYNPENIKYIRDWVKHWSKNKNNYNDCSLENLNSMINTWQTWFNKNLHNLPQVTIEQLKGFFEEEGYTSTEEYTLINK